MGSGSSGLGKGGGGSTKNDVNRNRAFTPDEINSLSARERQSYYDTLPTGSRVTIESQGMGGTSQTNVLYKDPVPNWQGYEWKVESGPTSSVSHFDTTYVPSSSLAYGRVKVKKVTPPGVYD